MEIEPEKLNVNEFLSLLELNFEKLSKAEKEKAKMWAFILVAGIERKLWCGCSSLKEIKERFSEMIDSFEKKLIYVM